MRRGWLALMLGGVRTTGALGYARAGPP